MNEAELGTFKSEVRRRRSFAIISHPDAGKTTLTEKLLLYSGQIRTAGEVKAKANRRKTVSDWMELEQERGISVSSTVLQFDYEGLRINLLDTPGHKDFSEDTYRTLMAADTAVMVMDAAKGVELQTRKLFEVCRLRGLPVLTFINKMDREAIDPLEMLEQIEEVLGIAAVPVTWPVGMGDRFKGVYDRLKRQFHYFEPSEEVGKEAQHKIIAGEPNNEDLKKYLDSDEIEKLVEDMELLDGLLGDVSREKFLKGEITPTLFGSAKSTFGIPTFLENFKSFAPEPQLKDASPEPVDPYNSNFSAFVFKIQANMDPSHRDRMAFLRICSGVFDRDMNVKNTRLEKQIRMSHAKQFWGQDRATVEKAYSGDIVGVHDPGHFQIGDTLYTGPRLEFQGIPKFSPECFAKVTLKDPLKRKQLQKGVRELSEEGLLQLFVDPIIGEQDPILGVVGVLQFDVMMHRLKTEYKVESKLDRQPFTMARWFNLPEGKTVKDYDLRAKLVQDKQGNWVALFKSDWEFDYCKREQGKDLDWKIAGF